MLQRGRKPLYHQQCPSRHETQFQHPPSASTHVVDKTYSEAIDHGKPQDVPDYAATATHPTSVMDINFALLRVNVTYEYETNKSMLPRRSSHMRQPAVKLDPRYRQCVIKGSTI